MQSVTDPVADEHLDVDAGDGLHLHVIRAGDGPPVVVLHGFTGSTETWSPLKRDIGSRYATIAVDLPGHGRSSAPEDPGRYTIDRFSDDLALVLDRLEIERAAVLGYSMGGRAALRFSLRHPGRVAALILESASPGIADLDERAARATSDRAIAEMILRDGIGAFTDYWESLPIWKSQSSLPDEERARLRAQRLTNDSRGLAGSLRGAGAGADPSVIDLLDTHLLPTLLIAGALDEKYVAASRLMEASMPSAHAAIVENAGHAVHLEQPDAFASLIVNFLEDLPSAGKRWL